MAKKLSKMLYRKEYTVEWRLKESHASGYLVVFGSCPPPPVCYIRARNAHNPGLSLNISSPCISGRRSPTFKPTGGVGWGSGATEDESKKGVELCIPIYSNGEKPYTHLVHSRVGLNKNTAQYSSTQCNSANLVHRFRLGWRCFSALIF